LVGHDGPGREFLHRARGASSISSRSGRNASEVEVKFIAETTGPSRVERECPSGMR